MSVSIEAQLCLKEQKKNDNIKIPTPLVVPNPTGVEVSTQEITGISD